MKYLITGSNGQLGYDINKELVDRNVKDIFLGTRENLDITNENQVKECLLSYKPDVIFHCAAYTKVDAAETDRNACYNVNVNGTKNIVKYAKEIGSKVVYFSTDYVFDGTKDNLYDEIDKPNPINYYGLTKYLGEEEVKTSDNYLIARISWVFGINGNNFVKTMIKLGKAKESLNVISDQIGSPTYTKDLAKKILDMVDKNSIGIFNITNEGYCSWNEFAKEIMKINNIDIKVNEISTAKYKSAAKRPLNSKLNKSKLISSGFDALPTWQDALNRFNIELKQSEGKKMLDVTETCLKDCYILNPSKFGDDRGYFSPFFIQEELRKNNIDFAGVVQCSRSKSSKGVIRGLHYQKDPKCQAKIVEVIKGSVIDVVVDIRVGSPTYGKSFTTYLSSDNNTQLFVPRGFAHGFISLEDDTIFQYLVDNDYAPELEDGIYWNDPDLDINWQEIFKEYDIKNISMTTKDTMRQKLSDKEIDFRYNK